MDEQIHQAESKILTLLEERTGQIARDIAEIKADLRANFVRREEFQPVRNIVFGMAGLTLITVAAALLMLVVRR